MAATIPATMSAVIFDSAAPHGMLFAPSVPVLQPTGAQVLIRVHASALNHEYKMFKIEGKSMAGKGAGWDVAGVVVAKGPGLDTSSTRCPVRTTRRTST